MLSTKQTSLILDSGMECRKVRRIDKRRKSVTRRVVISLSHICKVVDTLAIPTEAFFPVDHVTSYMRDIPVFPAKNENWFKQQGMHANGPETHSSLPLPITRWKVKDMSVGGYSLVWESKLRNLAKIGQLVSIEEKVKHHSSWCLGSIRWIRQKNGYMDVGIEVFGFDVKKLSIYKKNAKSIRQVDALYLNVNDEGHVFVSPNINKISENNTIRCHQLLDDLKIKKKLGSSSFYQHYLVDHDV